MCDAGRTRLDAEAVVRAIRSVAGSHSSGTVALHEPCFRGNEWAYVKECLDTGWVSSVGAFVDRFEGHLVDYTGVKHAVATVNGTAALHVALVLAGVETCDEVLVPALTFVATANAVHYCGAVPHFVDISDSTLGMDAVKLEAYLRDTASMQAGECVNRWTGRRIRAAVPVHVFGHPVDLDPLAEVCQRYGIVLVEDAAEALGSRYKGRHVGNHGLVAALSFNGNKVVTTGGGGAILTNDEGLARVARHLTTTARVAHRWDFRHDAVGYNYRMPNLNAALGCAQLERLEEMVADKRRLARRYAEAFGGVPGVRVFTEREWARSNYWLNALLLDAECAGYRDEVLAAASRAEISTRPAWALMHHLPMYADCPRAELEVAEDLARRIVNIPSSAILGEGL